MDIKININDILNEEIRSSLLKYQNEFIYYMNIIIDSLIANIIIAVILLIYFYKKIIKFNENRKLLKRKKEKDLYNQGETKRFTQKNYFIAYKIPDNVKLKFLRKYQEYKPIDFINIEKVLMDYFSLYLPQYGTRNVFFTMHSKIANDLWHMFSLFEKEYEEFCMNSFGSIIKFIPYKNNEPIQIILNTHKMLKINNKTKGFDLDKQYGVDNKYDNDFIFKIENILYKDISKRTLEENELILSFGLNVQKN